MDTLLHQEGEEDPEVRSLSLQTLNDDDWLALAALFWMQIGWFWALAITGWLWLFGFVAADLFMFSARWKTRRGRMPVGPRFASVSAAMAAPVNIAFVALISADIFVLTQAPSDRTAILGLVLAIGFCGYVTALFTAFPVLATLNIAMLTGSLSLGLVVGPSDTARPFAALTPCAAIAFLLLIRRTHVTLLGSIRSQRTHRLLSLHDPLTKLPNRAFMRETLMHHLSRVGTKGGPSKVAVLCLDLDGFKGVNDRFGHAAGDWVLVHVADILRRHMEIGEDVCRIGGDEYVFLLPGAGETRVRSLGRAIVEEVSEPFDIGRTIPARIGISIGAAVARSPGCRIDALLEEADGALYAAKRAGRGRLHLSPGPGATASAITA